VVVVEEKEEEEEEEKKEEEEKEEEKKEEEEKEEVEKEEKDEVTRTYHIRGDDFPLPAAECEERYRRPSHSSKHEQRVLSLPAHHSLEEHEHEEGECGIYPVVVHAPKEETQHLEDEEWRHEVFLQSQSKIIKNLQRVKWHI
jgi:hypothetical protein